MGFLVLTGFPLLSMMVAFVLGFDVGKCGFGLWQRETEYVGLPSELSSISGNGNNLGAFLALF